MKSKYILLILLVLCLRTSSQEWKNYPYQPPGSLLEFPGDEGYHPGEEKEWWYINGHITGQTTGDSYAFMISYFYEPIFTYDGFRIFTLSNDSTKEFFEETMPCDYISLAEDSLNIIATVGYPTTHYEEWVTQTDTNGTMKPFQYHIAAESGNGSIDINCNTVKRPLILADSGFFYQGAEGYTYYYSQTMMEISGTISINSITEDITGFGWLDHQFGGFDPSAGEEYEWFCAQLDNGMDLNFWNIFTVNNEIPDTSTYTICSVYLNDSSAFTISEFDIERLSFAYTPDSERCYAQQWHLTADTFDIDLIISAQNSSNEVELPFRFFEGRTFINGTVQGAGTTGKGFAELLHSYEKPDIEIIYPDISDHWDGAENITWKLNNPDQGITLKYDIDISTDNKNTYKKIARVINDTAYYWNPSYFIEDTAAWLRITGYSSDSTLADTTENKTFIQTADKNYQLCNGDDFIFLVMLSEKENFTYQWQKNEGNIPGATDSIYFISSVTAGDNGDYRCIITGSLSTDTTISYNVNVNPLFETYGYDTICYSDSIYLGGEYQKTEGIYIDTLISVYGCDSIRTMDLSVESCGLNLRDYMNNDIRIFTNTVNRSVHMEFSKNTSGYIEILNIKGELLKVKKLENKREVVLDVSDLTEGIYLVRFRSGRIIRTKKIYYRL